MWNNQLTLTSCLLFVYITYLHDAYYKKYMALHAAITKPKAGTSFSANTCISITKDE